MNPITAAILAGGRSERMGRDKAQIVRQGETLLARTARAAQEAGCSVLIVGREPPGGWPLAGVRFAPDAVPRQGPLGGLATALGLAAATPVIALACDMPLLTVEALRWLKAQEAGPHGTAVQRGGQWEPLFSIYLPAVLPLLEAHLAAGRLSLQSLIAAGDFRTAVAPPVVAAALSNVNTPEDLAAL